VWCFGRQWFCAAVASMLVELVWLVELASEIKVMHLIDRSIVS
jgi:hypothetical protein